MDIGRVQRVIRVEPLDDPVRGRRGARRGESQGEKTCREIEAEPRDPRGPVKPVGGAAPAGGHRR